MQEKHTKGLFIDSSCRRVGLLKTLLHGLRHGHDEAGCGEAPTGHLRSAGFDPRTEGAGSDRREENMKRAVSL